MTLITPNIKPELVANKNLDYLLGLKNDLTKKDQVVTDVALEYFKENQESKLGWGYSGKKFLFSWGSYLAVLTTPVITLLGFGARYHSWIRTLLGVNGLSYLGLSVAGALAADKLFEKTTGIKPIYMMFLASVDGLRHGAKTLSKHIDNSYSSYQLKVESKIENNKASIKESLKTTYAGIGNELVKRIEKGSINQTEINTLKKHSKLLESLLTSLELTKGEVKEILSPLRTAFKIAELNQSSTPAVQSLNGPALRTLN